MSSSGEEEEAEFGDSDDAPLSSLKKTASNDSGARGSPRRKRKPVDYSEPPEEGEEEEEVEEEEQEGEEEEEEDDEEAEEDEEDEDDDDVPLASLKKSPSKSSTPKAKAKPKAKAAKSTSSKKKAKPAPAKSKSTSKAATNSSSKPTEYLSASAALYESDCKKGLLIQKLLCRWWYAVEWPDPSVIPAEPPKYYDRLNGFEGVYVCTSGDKVGHILDLRDRENCPSFKNYANKSSKELKELLLKALEEQKRQLIEAEGPGTATEKDINDDIKWLTKKVKPDEADKEAKTVLKAAKMKL